MTFLNVFHYQQLLSDRHINIFPLLNMAEYYGPSIFILTLHQPHTCISSEKVSVSKAYTYNLVNNKVEKTKLGSDSEFIEKINKFWSRKKIAMPNVKEGSIIEFKFEISSPYESNIPENNYCILNYPFQ